LQSYTLNVVLLTNSRWHFPFLLLLPNIIVFLLKIKLSASILLQAQQIIKSHYNDNDNSGGNNNNLISELGPLQCNYAYALLRSCSSNTSTNDPNNQQKRRLAEAFWNKVVATNDTPSSTATVVSKHNLSILKATNTSVNNTSITAKKRGEGKMAAMEDKSVLDHTPHAHKLLLPMQIFTFLRNKVIMCQLLKQQKEFGENVQEIRKIYRKDHGCYCADALVLEHGLLQLQEHQNTNNTVISLSEVATMLEEVRRKNPSDIYTIISLLLLQAQLSLDNNNTADAIHYMEQVNGLSSVRNLPGIISTLVSLYRKMEDNLYKEKLQALLDDVFKSTQETLSPASVTNVRRLTHIKSKADYLFDMGNTKDAAQIYETLITWLEDRVADEQLERCYHSCIASLIHAIMDDDAKRAQELDALLPDSLFQCADRIDPEELEEREMPRFQRARTQVLTSTGTANGSTKEE
jgi:hypothetical protein